MAFTDSYKHMECLGGMRLQSFPTNGHFVCPCNDGYPQLVYYKRPNSNVLCIGCCVMRVWWRNEEVICHTICSDHNVANF